MYTSLPLIILSLCAAIHGRPMPKGATRCKPDRSSTPTSIPVSTPASILVSTATSAYASASTSAPASIPASIPASVPSVSPPDVNGKQNNSASDLGFITRKGSQLFDGDEPFRFVSYNVPNLFLIEDKPGLKGTYLPPHPYEQQDAMATIAGSHGRVARSYTLAAGYGHHVPEIGTYNETAFLAMDHAIAAAKQHNVRLIIPLVNNHNGQDTPDSECNFGSYGSFTKLRRKKPSEFFTDETLRKDFKELLSFLLNRVNTVTGVAYKNEPIIMAWQLGNELGSWEKAVAPADWSLEIAGHIKSLAPKTLVMDGTIGGTQRIPKELLDSPLIDIFTNHFYGGDPKSVAKDAKEIALKDKVFIAGEFGFGDDLDYYKSFFETTLKTPEIAGSLIWSLRFHSIQGGFYVHSENDKWLSYHAPGFPESPGFHKEEKDLVPMIREYALRIQGQDVYSASFPVPSRPNRVEGIRATPKALRWMGSAWAKGYNIERKYMNGGDWTRIASNVPDNKESGQPLYSDAGSIASKPLVFKGKPASGSNWVYCQIKNSVYFCRSTLYIFRSFNIKSHLKSLIVLYLP